jgi:hypothetical protein
MKELRKVWVSVLQISLCSRKDEGTTFRHNDEYPVTQHHTLSTTAAET